MTTSSVRSKFTNDIARIAFPDARAAIVARTSALPHEMVSLVAATGRIVAQTYRATDDIVPFARSAMDGYALRSVDTASATVRTPVTLPVVGASYAGDGVATLASGNAAAITTGAMLPDGADAVVPFEEIERIGESIVMRAPLVALDHVFEPGDDAKRGETLVASGSVVSPGAAALLASAGFSHIVVTRRPRVAIVSTGNEIVAVDATPRLGQIRNSNATMLAASLVADGADVVFEEHVRDDAGAVRATLVRALACADLVITSGGASTGDRDYVKATLRDLGAEFAFDSIALRPSKPTAFATLGPTSIAVLPGNPAAAFVAYVALVRGALRRISGHDVAYRPYVDAVLRGSIRRKANRHFLMFASLSIVRGQLEAIPLVNQCSSLVRTSADANALVVVEPGSGAIAAGEIIACELIAHIF